MLTLALRDASVATSAQSERSRLIDGQLVGHVLDPRTGAPVRGALSATVLAPTGAAADAFATALLVLGPREGLAWAARRDDVSAAFLSATRASGGGARLDAEPAFLSRVTSTALQPTTTGRGTVR